MFDVNGSHTYDAFTLRTYFVSVTIADTQGSSHATVYTTIVDPPAAKASAASVNDAALMSIMGGSVDRPSPSKALDPAVLALLYGQN